MTCFFNLFSVRLHIAHLLEIQVRQFVGFRKRCYSGINVTFKNWSSRQWLMVGFHCVTLRVIFDKAGLPSPTHTHTPSLSKLLQKLYQFEILTLRIFSVYGREGRSITVLSTNTSTHQLQVCSPLVPYLRRAADQQQHHIHDNLTDLGFKTKWCSPAFTRTGW